MKIALMHFLRLMKTPSAFLPFVMSFAALSVVIVHLLESGTARESDEGAAAHVFQALMVAQIPIVALFAAKFVPKEPKNALVVVLLQICTALVALTPVWVFHL